MRRQVLHDLVQVQADLDEKIRGVGEAHREQHVVVGDRGHPVREREASTAAVRAVASELGDEGDVP